MKDFSAIGIDTSKAHFAVSGADAGGREVWREGGTPARINDEARRAAADADRDRGVPGRACARARARRDGARRPHRAAASLAKPFVGRNKHDAADARAICRAVREPDTTFVPIKSEAEQADAMLVGHRRALHERRTEIGNRNSRLCGRARAEGAAGRAPRPGAPGPAARARGICRRMRGSSSRTSPTNGSVSAPRIAAAEAQLVKAARTKPECRRLMEVPSVGPVVAWRTVLAVGDPRRFPHRARLRRPGSGSPPQTTRPPTSSAWARSRERATWP